MSKTTLEGSRVVSYFVHFYYFSPSIMPQFLWQYSCVAQFRCFPNAIQRNWKEGTTFFIIWGEIEKVSCGWNPVWQVEHIFKFSNNKRLLNNFLTSMEQSLPHIDKKSLLSKALKKHWFIEAIVKNSFLAFAQVKWMLLVHQLFNRRVTFARSYFTCRLYGSDDYVGSEL